MCVCDIVGDALPGAAIAQDAVDDGVYVRVAAGANFASGLDQDITYNPNLAFAVAPPSRQMLAIGEGLTAAVALGFDYADGIRTELEYRYAKTDIDGVTVGGGFAPDVTTFPNEDLAAHLVMANFYFDFTNDSPFTPFIGGGVGGAFVSNEVGATDAALGAARSRRCFIRPWRWRFRSVQNLYISDLMNWPMAQTMMNLRPRGHLKRALTVIAISHHQ